MVDEVEQQRARWGRSGPHAGHGHRDVRLSHARRASTISGPWRRLLDLLLLCLISQGKTKKTNSNKRAMLTRKLGWVQAVMGHLFK